MKSKILTVILSVFLFSQIGFAQLCAKLIDVAAGEYHTLALAEDNSLWATGDNGYGQLGLGNTTDILSLQRVHGPNNIGFLNNVIAFDAGWYHSLAVDSNYVCWSFGTDTCGQLGNGNEGSSSVPTLVHGLNNDANGLRNIVKVSAGRSGEHSLFLRNDGYVLSCGCNNYGQCATEDTNSTNQFPHLVVDSDPNTTGRYLGDEAFIIDVDAGTYHSLALASMNDGGVVYEWGYGVGSIPLKVPGISNIIDIATCGFSLATDSNGNVWYWTTAGNPTKIAGGQMGTTYLENIVKVAAGIGDKCAALDANGQVWEWSGSSGSPAKVTDGAMQTQSGYLENIVALDSGFTDFRVAVDKYGRGWSWGSAASSYGGIGGVSATEPVEMLCADASPPAYFEKSFEIQWQPDPNIGCVYPFEEGLDNYLVFEISYGNPVTNPSDPNYVGTIYNANIIDYLPFEVDFNSATAGAVYDANNHTVTLNVGTLSPGSEGSFEIVTKVNHHAFPLTELHNYSEFNAYQYYSVAEVNVPVCFWGGEVIYVDKDANGFNNGTSWDDAFSNLQDGLAEAQRLGDNITAIWVAAGSYKPVESTSVPSYQSKTFTMLNNLALIGHFGGIGTYEDSPDARNLADANNTTILEGRIGTTASEAVYNIVTAANISNALIDGFTIQNSYNGSYPGAVYLNNSDVSIVNCRFENNRQYGIYAYLYSYPDIHNCIFFNNTTAGIYNNSHCQPGVSYSVFDGNNVSTTRGLQIDNICAATVENCIFRNNNYYGIYGSNNGSLDVSNSQFTNNQYGLYLSDILTELTDCNITNSTYYGLYGSTSNITIENTTIAGSTRYGAYITSDSSAAIENSIVKNNLYGGIYASDSDFSISHSLVSGNSQNGIYAVGGCNPVVTNSVIRQNGYNGLRLADCPTTSVKNCWINKNGTAHSTSNGCSGIYLENTSQTPLLRNNTIYDNNTYGIQANQYGPDPNVRNCIIYGNDVNDFYRISGSFSKVNYCCLQTEMSGTGNFVADPIFTNGTDPNNLHIDDDSPCVDTGDPCGIYLGETDIDDEPRNSGRVDVGGDENYRSKADYDESGIVDFYDFATFSGAWQSTSETVSLDDDNDVDAADLELFCRDWLWQRQTDGWMLMQMMGSSGNGSNNESAIIDLPTATSDSLMITDVQTSKVLRPKRLADRTNAFYAITPQSVAAWKAKITNFKTETEPAVDVNEILNWLDELWLSSDLKETMSEEEYQEFRKTIEELGQY